MDRGRVGGRKRGRGGDEEFLSEEELGEFLGRLVLRLDLRSRFIRIHSRRSREGRGERLTLM